MRMSDALRVLGVDPGLGGTGYAVLEYRNGLLVQLIEGGIIKTPVGQALESRLSQIHTALEEIMIEFKPDVLAVEDLYTDYKHPQTALLMAHARGVCLLAAGRAGVKVYHYPAKKVKQSLTGTGSATKGQVQRMVQTRLNLDSLPRPDHVADAIAVAMCHVLHDHALEEC